MAEMKLPKQNEIFIKINKPFISPGIVEINSTYDIAVRVCVNDFKTVNQHNGTADYIFLAESMGDGVIVNKAGEKRTLKTKSKQSQQFRFLLMNKYNESEKLQEQFKEFESFYDFAYGKIKHNIDAILREI